MALITGNANDNLLLGTIDPDTIRGRDGDDTLVGGRGGDLLDGGTGTDRASYLASFEGVTVVLGTFPIGGVGLGGTADGDTLLGIEDLTGSAFGDRLTGNGLANAFRGGDGDDRLFGGGGDDVLDGGNGNDLLRGGAGDDDLRGGAGIDTADYSGAGSSVSINLTAGTARVSLDQDDLAVIENATGSGLADFIFGDNAANRLVGGGGDDLLSGLGGEDRLLGGAGDDDLFGGAEGDTLDGGRGADRMVGQSGDDTYIVDDAGDTVSEEGGSGLDAVRASRSVNLSSNQFDGDIENVTLTGTGDTSATGDALANTLRGNAGDNGLDGGAGSDTMIGGRGDDTYVVSGGGDRVDEGTAGADGVDTVASAVTFDLNGAQVSGVVENLVLGGAAAINGVGNDLGNLLAGNGADNALTGRGGNDTLVGGGGADTFVFQARLDAATNVDTITDFNVAQDTIRLENLFMTGLATGELDADAFHVGATAADASDRIVYQERTGALLYDADGAGGAAAIRFATLDAGLALTSADIFVV